MPIFHARSQLDWSVIKLELDILERIASDNVMAASGTWIGPEIINQFSQWCDEDPNRYAVFVCSMDPMDWLGHGLKVNERVHFIDSGYLCLWLMNAERSFVNYTTEQVMPLSFKNKFLCYQRKPHNYRITMFDKFKDRTDGLITLSGHDFSDINVDIPDNLGFKEMLVGPEELALGMMPSDIFSLGNPEIWNSSFLNIVSETEQNWHTTTPFISEKTLKPIIGMRPFINVHPYIHRMLEDRGFKTFNEDFGYEPEKYTNVNDLIDHIYEVVDNMPDPKVLWEKVYPKILHNREHFSVAVANEWKKVNQLADKYRKLTER